MSDEQDTPKPELRFSADVDYYDSTDFALLTAEVTNDGWVGSGDAMLTLAVLRPDGTVQQVHIPVSVDNGPVTRGARITFPVENATMMQHGETQLSLIELSGGDPAGADTWTVWYAPIRNPFE
jgi:hypothetical protein